MQYSWLARIFIIFIAYVLGTSTPLQAGSNEVIDDLWLDTVIENTLTWLIVLIVVWLVWRRLKRGVSWPSRLSWLELSVFFVVLHLALLPSLRSVEARYTSILLMVLLLVIWLQRLFQLIFHRDRTRNVVLALLGFLLHSFAIFAVFSFALDVLTQNLHG